MNACWTGCSCPLTMSPSSVVTGSDPATIELIARTPRVLRALLSGLPAVVLSTPNAEGWSVKHVVAHLHDVEGVAFVERISRMLDEDQPLIESIDPPARLEAGGYALRGLDE